MGIVLPERSAATIGTSRRRVCRHRSPLDPRGPRHDTFCHAIPRAAGRHGRNAGAGLSLRWFRDTFATELERCRESYDQLTYEAAKGPAGSDGLL